MKKIIPVIIILISTIFLTLTYLNKPFNNNSIKLTSHNNQNVQNYAEKNNFNYQNISDSELNELKSNDNFTYNIKNNQIEVTGYKGSEKQIIIPETIENLPVTTISMSLDKAPSEIYIPSSVITINQIIDENIKSINNSSIKLTSHNNQNVQNYAEKNNFNYQNISDSELNELKSNDNFTYNIKNKQIEVTGYKGSEKQIIIPETIENLPVTTISMNLDKMPSEIYIPSSVITINQIIDENINNNFYLAIIIELVALIITLLIILILNKKKNQDKTVYITFLYILSIIYLFAINIYAYLNINNLLIITIVTTIIYFIIFLPLYFVKNRLKEYDKKINNIQNFIEEALNIAKKINNQDLVEALKFSDPISSEFTKESEEAILEKLNKTADNPTEEKINEILNLIIERNNICKKTKGKY